MAKPERKSVLAVVSDIHAGSAVALCCPEPVELDDGGTFTPSAPQRWLHANWLDFWQKVGTAKKDADYFGVMVTGDAVEGDHHGSLQVVSRDPAVQMWILKKCFEPVLALAPDQAVVIRGTETHVGKSGSAEEHFARWLAKEGVGVPRDPSNKMYSWWNYDGMLAGHHISAAHHGRVGQRPWTRSGVVGNLAAQIVMERANRGDPIPDLAFRGHLHTYHDTHDAFRTRLIQMPAWQLHTAFAHKVVPECLADIGGIIVTLEPGKKPEVEAVLYRPQRPKPVRMG